MEENLMNIEQKCNHMILTKEEIFKQDFYDITVYSLKDGCFVDVSLESIAVWEMYKSYQKLGSVKRWFPCFWDYVHALCSYDI